jgi:hypothetical protein
MDLVITDDGTLDTVVYCQDCNTQMRYNPEPLIEEEYDSPPTKALDEERQRLALEMARKDHKCLKPTRPQGW